MNIKYVDIRNLSFSDVSTYVKLLPKYRQDKINRYRFDKDKLQSTVAGLLLLSELGDTKLNFGKNGKPYTAEKNIYFSLSHSDSVVVTATDSVELGVDAEGIKDESRIKIADRFYHKNERDSVYGSPAHLEEFCRIWTRKEAYLKMTGEGISTDLTAFDTLSAPLKKQIFSVKLCGSFLSVCSAEEINEENILISETELKELLNKLG